MKLVFKRQDIYEEHAKALGKTLQPHEGFHRENSGDWIILDDTGRRVCTVSFRGKAKRGEAWNAPDPEGQALAQQIVDAFNGAAPTGREARPDIDSQLAEIARKWAASTVEGLVKRNIVGRYLADEADARDAIGEAIKNAIHEALVARAALKTSEGA